MALKAATLIAVYLFPALAAHSDSPYRIVVNLSNPVTSTTRAQVSDMFLKKMTVWKHGGRVLPVDQSPNNPVREHFSRSIHRMSVDLVKMYWQKSIFSGRDVPPLQQRDDLKVLEYVKANANAIGYISSDAPVEGVKVLNITDD